MSYRILFFLLILISGCAIVPFEVREKERTRLITWKTVDDVDSYCRSIMTKQPLPYPLFIVYGCASWTSTRCTIYTNNVTDMGILGHETRHCFDGQFHD